MGFDMDTRERKTLLVTWHKLTQPRDRGGLDFINFKTHAQALLSKALVEPRTEWARLFLAPSSDFTWEQCQSINRAHYTPLDKLLLTSIKSCQYMPYTAGIWKAQATLQCHLLLSPTGNSLPTHWQEKTFSTFFNPLATWMMISCVPS